jgi:integrase
MASLIKDPGGRWRIQFVGGDKHRRTIRLGKMNKDSAQAIKVKVERLVSASISGHALDNETAAWIAKRGDVLADRLAAVGLIPKRSKKEAATLGPFIDAYIVTRKDAKPGTLTIWRQGKANLMTFFGENKPLVEVTPGDADEFKIELTTRKQKNHSGKKLSAQGADKLLRFAKLIFRAAKRKDLISANPFQDVKIKFAEVEDERFITHDDTLKLLDACSNHVWRVIVALSRFGGLRCPSEVLSLRIQDIDWDAGKMEVQSPKTEHHDGKATRTVPIFPELRPYLEEAFEMAPEGAVHLVSDEMRARANGPDGWVNVNLRTTMEKIVKRAGLKPWKRLFHNLRASRQTELEDQFPTHVVCKWLGNSPKIARKNYLKVTQEHYQRALQGGAKGGALEAQNEAQQAGEGECEKVNNTRHSTEKGRKKPEKIRSPQDNSLSCAVAGAFVQADLMGGAGLEPVTSTMSTLRSNQLS